MSQMANTVEILSHASALISCGGVKILCDPWYFGTAFNGGWALYPTPDLAEIKEKLKDVTYLWISHEHPDHLHFETLKEIRSSLPENVTILFQQTNSDKVFIALRKIGYSQFRSIKHLEVVDLNDNVKISVYCHRQLDSALLVMPNGENWLLNINDTELNDHDMKIISKRFGDFPVLLNQFSVAGYDGLDALIEADAKSVISKMISHHRGLGAKVTIPFASFMRFCQTDNEHLNRFTNTVFDAKTAFSDNSFELLIMKPQDSPARWDRNKNNFSNSEAIGDRGESYFKGFYENPHKDESTTDHDGFNRPVGLAELASVVQARTSSWKRLTSSLVFQRLKPIHVKLLDHDSAVYTIDFQQCSFERNPQQQQHDLEINSQPLWFAFKMPFGFQTLGVSGRYKFNSKYDAVPGTWKIVRVLSSLENAEVYLSLRGLFSSATLGWIWQRREGLLSQMLQQISRFSR